MIQLRDYQMGAIQAIEAAIDLGCRRQLVVMPTGSGKTVVFAELIRRRQGRALVLAHRDELLHQAVDKIRFAAPESSPGVVKADRDDVGASIVVASVQTLSRPRRLRRLLATASRSAPFSTVIVDEAHHSTADSYRSVLQALGCLDDDGPLTVGMTATPFRPELADLWQDLVYNLEIVPMIRDGYLCDLRGVQVRLKADLNRLRVSHGDFVDSEMEELLLDASAPKHVAASYLEHARDRKGLVFTPTVEVAQETTRALREAGVPTETVHGGTRCRERHAILERLRTGATQVVSNCAVLTEGFDEPSVSCIVMARPSRSSTLYAQCVGRGLRVYPGKRDCLVLDLVGCSNRNDLVTATSYFGLAAGRGRRMGGSRAPGERDSQSEAPAVEGTLVSFTVELFERRDFQWINAGGRFTLSLGGVSSLILEEDGAGGWQVARYDGPGRRAIIAAGLPLGYAQGMAEDLVRKERAAVLNLRDAGWRKEEASEKQQRLLDRWGRWRAGMSRGEASDVISRVMARKLA